MTKYVIFTLSMPGNNAWNGRWSGETDKYVRCRTLPKAGLESIKDGDYHTYNFGDGWCAAVSVQIIEGARAKNLAEKNSKGFCGYDWMIDSILKHGFITVEED